MFQNVSYFANSPLSQAMKHHKTRQKGLSYLTISVSFYCSILDENIGDTDMKRIDTIVQDPSTQEVMVYDRTRFGR